MNKEFPVLYREKEECCGCGACCAVCPVCAISMAPDEEGFDYPEADSSVCIRCGRCLLVCPLKVPKRRDRGKGKNI